MPKLPIFSNISWNTVYDAGAIYGTDDTGTYNAGLPVSQLKLVNKDQWRFKVRTLMQWNTDPSTQATNYESSYHSSIYTDLIYRVTTEAIAGYPADRWASYAAIADLGMLQWELCVETLASDTSSAEFRTANPKLGRNTSFLKSQLAATFYWRPVLEIVPDSALFKPQNTRVSTAGIGALASGLTITPVEDDATLYRLSAVTPIPNSSISAAAAISSIATL
jgi:hypothetical protein